MKATGSDGSSAAQAQRSGVRNGIGDPQNCSKKPAPIGAGF